MHAFTDRANDLGTGINFSFYERLPIDLITCDKLLLQKPHFRIKTFRARHNFIEPSNNPKVSLKIFECSLFTRRVLVAEPKHQLF